MLHTYMDENRAILAPIDREIIRTARRTWVKELMFRDTRLDNLDVDLDIPFFVVEPKKGSASKAICDGQRRLWAYAYNSEDGLSPPNLDYFARLLNSKDAQS